MTDKKTPEAKPSASKKPSASNVFPMFEGIERTPPAPRVKPSEFLPQISAFASAMMPVIAQGLEAKSREQTAADIREMHDHEFRMAALRAAQGQKL